MRMTPKHRHRRRSKAPRVSISQAEITADLLYPAGPQAGRQRGGTPRIREVAR
jgi:hypothetical protein